MKNNGRLVDRTGDRVGILTVTSYAGRNEKGKPQWNCKCDCGRDTIVPSRELAREHVKSCGECGYNELRIQQRRKYHSKDEDRLRHVLNRMKYRCNNPNDKEYHRYGGRGIRVCEEWMGDTKVFIDWALQHGYKKGLTLERNNNNGNYTPENCSFKGRTEQMNNMSRNHIIQITDEVKMTRAQCARLIGIKYDKARSLGDEKVADQVRTCLSKNNTVGINLRPRHPNEEE